VVPVIAEAWTPKMGCGSAMDISQRKKWEKKSAAEREKG
jgi:hypothetical protein